MVADGQTYDDCTYNFPYEAFRLSSLASVASPQSGRGHMVLQLNLQTIPLGGDQGEYPPVS